MNASLSLHLHHSHITLDLDAFLSLIFGIQSAVGVGGVGFPVAGVGYFTGGRFWIQYYM